MQARRAQEGRRC